MKNSKISERKKENIKESLKSIEKIISDALGLVFSNDEELAKMLPKPTQSYHGSSTIALNCNKMIKMQEDNNKAT
jgi:hypothetical protein